MNIKLIEQLSPEYKAHYKLLMLQGSLGEEGAYRFGDAEDPYAEKERTELEVIEYVVFSYASSVYKPKLHELKKKVNDLTLQLKKGSK